MSDEQLSPTATVVIAERSQRRWSQARLAEELATATEDEGWKRPRVARLESDRLVIDLDTIQALSKVFDLDYATLIDGYTRRSRGDVTARSHRNASDLLLSDHSDHFDLIPAALAA